VDVNRFFELIEDAEPICLLDDETDNLLDPILEEAESRREDLCQNLTDLGLKNAEIMSGSVNKKAYWSWSFLIGSDNQLLQCTIILYLDADDTSKYSVEVALPTGRAWATSNVAPADQAAANAFEELKRLFALIAEQEN
jgi:hypothetical protein